MRRRTFLSASAAALALPAISRAEDQRVLKFIAQSDLAILDPIWTTAYVTRNHGYMVFDTLYGQTGQSGGYKATPQMVAGHVVEDDGKTWKLTLRDGLTFHDGEKVLARDCAASIKRWGVRDAFGQALMARTDELSAPDDKIILFRLKQPFALLPDAMCHGASNMCAMMPQRIAETDPFKAFTEVVGSGPFRFKSDERVPGSLAVYEKFDKYKPREDGEASFTSGPKIVHFDRVEWHIQPDAATKAAAIQAGEMDWWENPPADLLPNHLYPPFDKPAVRRALMGAIDQKEFMFAVMGEDTSLWSAPVGFFPLASPMANDAGMSALTSPRDPAAVKTALEKAGYQGETVVLMGAADQPTNYPLAEVAADMLKRVGVKVDYQSTDWGTVVQRRALTKPPAEGGWNMFCTGFSGLDWFTPASHLPLRGNGKNAWFGWPTAPKLEALRDAWFMAPDLASQKAIAAKIQLQAFEDVPFYPLGLGRVTTAFRQDITGLQEGFVIFWNVRRV
jgi:peptide/nickel transport system substrate-binding protein